jgi:hypothetical protein
MLYTVSELEPALAEADAEVAKIREALAEAEKMRAFIASRLERARAREAESRLTNMLPKRSMLSSKMELQKPPTSTRVKIAATKTERASDAKRALLEAGLTDGDVAKLLKVGRSTVNAWCGGTRPIPQRYAEALKTKHKISLNVWPKTS